MKRWWPLVALATAQFVMVLDQSVMNVSISALVDDFDTTVTTIQAVITLYCLVMAMFMLTGGKIGDIIGRRRAFVVGLVIYGCGSALTAVAQTVAILTLGWSILEGLGAALVLPAMAALIAGNFEGAERKIAYAVIGGVAGAGIAIGPILGGWATTELSLAHRLRRRGRAGGVHPGHDPRCGRRAATGAPPRLDVRRHRRCPPPAWARSCSAALQSSTWGWIKPKDSPVEPFGFSLTLFVIAAGAVLIWAFVAWQRHREATGTRPAGAPRPAQGSAAALGADRPVHARTSSSWACSSSSRSTCSWSSGLDALETGIKMLPVSITMFLASAMGSRLSAAVPGAHDRASRPVDHRGRRRSLLLATVQPDLGRRRVRLVDGGARRRDGPAWSRSSATSCSPPSTPPGGARPAACSTPASSWARRSASRSSVPSCSPASPASFVSKIEADDRISAEVSAQVSVAVESGLDFVASSEIEAAAQEAGLDEATTEAHRRRLRAGPAAGAQDRPAGRRPAGAGLPGLHPRAAARAAHPREERFGPGRGGLTRAWSARGRPGAGR